jgi:hypothetical protein
MELDALTGILAFSLLVNLFIALRWVMSFRTATFSRYVELDDDLVVLSDRSDKRFGLPAGTRLYFDSSFAEGFTRYRVYVNMIGELAISGQSTTRKSCRPVVGRLDGLPDADLS